MFKKFVDGVEWLVAVAAVVTVVMLFTLGPEVATEASPDVQAGAEIYSAKCAGCHGSDGSGGVGPALAGANALSRFETSADLTRFVSVGSPGSMPGFETRLTPDEINSVSEFVFGGFGS